jgi:urease accessory protein UreF
MDSAQQPSAPASSEELAGEMSPLTHAIGSPAGLASLSDLAELVDTPRPESIPAVRTFIARFRERLLAPVELPAIRDAYHHARRGELRELLDLDRRLSANYGRSAFADASRHVGRTQLRRLRPLRDRTAQRYLQAVEAGEATGWHVVVYGLLLALFSMPLRQALGHYATRTQFSLLESATLGLTASAQERDQLHEECLAPAAAAVNHLLPAFDPFAPR